MVKKFSNVKLIDFDDEGYQRYVAPFLLARKRWKPGAISARSRFGYEVEEVIRVWLAEHTTLVPERVLQYTEWGHGRQARNYRELDAVEQRPDGLFFYEIKASRSAQSLRRGIAQVKKTGHILSTAFKGVKGFIFFVCTDAEVLPELQVVIEETEGVSLLASFQERETWPEPVGVLVLSVADIVAIAGEEALTLEWEDEEGEELEIEPEEEEWVEDWRTYQAQVEEEEVGALGAALLAALEEKKDED